jgi:excinuclease ABC subunit A
MEPRVFSFNAPHGACPDCHGLGFQQVIDPELLVIKSLSIRAGAFSAGKLSNSTFFTEMVNAAARHAKINLDTPWYKLARKDRVYLLYGSKSARPLEVSYRNFMGRTRMRKIVFRGAIFELQSRYQRHLERQSETEKADYVMRKLEEIMSLQTCPTCHGARLRPEVLAVTIGSKSIYEATELSVEDARLFFNELDLTELEYEIGRRVLKEIRERLTFLDDVGLGYLTLARTATTLSGGESRRIQLSSSLAQALRGLTAILDEPSVGLHQRDNERLIATMEHLRDQGNTVIVVEHDEQTQLSADWLIDMGPGAGEFGGKVISQGTPEEVKSDPKSLTGLYLSGKRFIPIPERRKKSQGRLKVRGASEHTLKNLDIEFPLQKFVCVTGVSGSGKSTLVNEILYKGLVHELGQAKMKAGAHKKIEGVSKIEKVIDIDQSPIGRTPRSNPATYTKVFDDIRAIFAMTKEARSRGWKPGRFSFNVTGGRCEVCKGDGYITKEMHFLPDIQVKCEACNGKRFNKETLSVLYKGKSIADVLAMSVEEAHEFFINIPKIKRKLQTLHDVGLGYIRLGQPATTLSGGEAQRVKLSTHLSKSLYLNKGKLVILDEPTTGLSSADIHELLKTLHRMVDAGVSIICIEHNLDVIKTADWIIDLGPEGGVAGGELVVCGTPEEVSECEASWTGRFLKDTLAQTRSHMEDEFVGQDMPGKAARSKRTLVAPTKMESLLSNV